MSSNDPPLQTSPDGGMLADKSDDGRQRDVGATSEPTSGAPAGCWANEANPKQDETTQDAASPETPDNRVSDEAADKANDVSDGNLSVNAPGGTSDFSSEPVSPANAIKSRRDFEAFLRTNGFSRAAAKAIAANGWRSIGRDETEAGTLDEELLSQAYQLLAFIKGQPKD